MKLGFSRKHLVLDLVTVVGLALATAFGPWWNFVVIAWIAGYERARRGGDGVLPPALLAAFTWFSFAFVQDAMNGFRISKRIGGFFGLPHGSLLYVVLVMIAFLLASLAAASGSQLGLFGRSKAAR